MRADVKLGLAVGSILFGVVLVYVLFVAGGNKPDQQANDQTPVPDVQPGATVGTDSHQTPSHQDLTAAAGGTQNNAFGQGGVAVGPTTTPVSPATSDITVGHSTPAPGAAITTPRGGFNWGEALSHGAAGGLLAHTETPTFTPATRPSGAMGDANAFVAPGGSESGTAAPAGTTPRTYVVKAGESFWSIAKATYGSASYYPHLARANPNINPSKLKAGMKINLPSKEEVVAPSATAVLGAVAPATRSIDPSTQYRVQAGDSLQSISKHLYGKADRWEKIYQLNKEAIGSNPSVLKLNMVLQLPEPPANGGTAHGAIQ